MQRSDFSTLQEFAQYIAHLEREYTDRLFHALYRNAGNIQAWYNEPNKVPDTWVGKMVISPSEPSAPWEQVGEIVIGGVISRARLQRHFSGWQGRSRRASLSR